MASPDPACQKVISHPIGVCVRPSPSPTEAAPKHSQADYSSNSPHTDYASDYNSAFNSQSGWTGADGTYSIGLPHGRTLWLFSDTLIGEVDGNGQRTLDPQVPVNLNGHRFINNSLAIQQDGEAKRFNFIIGESKGAPCSLFCPENSMEWFWINDAVRNDDGTITVLLNSFTGSSQARFCYGRQTALWTANLRVLGNEVHISNYHQVCAVDQPGASGCEIIWGAAAMMDGPWTYIYGSQLPPVSYPPQRRMVIARTPSGHITDNDAWQFFNGNEFVADHRQCAALPLPVSPEFSVQQLQHNCYLLTFADGYGPINCSFSRQPTGPWSEPQSVWRAAELTDTIYSYNAKAHPAASDQRGLLISYNVNSCDIHESLEQANVYRPRFIRVPWKKIETMANDADINFYYCSTTPLHG